MFNGLKGVIRGCPEDTGDLEAILHYFKGVTSYIDRGKVEININLDDAALSSVKASSCNLYSPVHANKMVQTMIKGIMNLITGGKRIDFEVETLSIIEAGTTLMNYFPQNPPRYFNRSDLTYLTHSETDGGAILLEALKNQELRNVLMAVSYSEDWSKLYYAWEAISTSITKNNLKIKGDRKKIVAEVLDIPWNRKDIGDFCNMANTCLNPLEGAKHAKGLNDPIVPNIFWGFQVIRKIVIRWLDKYYNLKIIHAGPSKDKMSRGSPPEVLEQIKIIDYLEILR